MTTGRKNLVKLTLIILTTVLLSGQIFASNISDKNFTKSTGIEITEAAIKTLAMGIETGNLGLRRSCIYLAGYYEIKELVQTLTGQLAKETDADTKLLIVLAIYKIGDTEAQKAIQELANIDFGPGVKDLVKAVNNNFKIQSSFTDH